MRDSGSDNHLDCVHVRHGLNLPFAFSATVILHGINLPACQTDFSTSFSWCNSFIDFSVAPLWCLSPVQSHHQRGSGGDWSGIPIIVEATSLRSIHWYRVGLRFDVPTIFDLVAKIQTNQTRHLFPNLILWNSLWVNRNFCPGFLCNISTWFPAAASRATLCWFRFVTLSSFKQGEG